MIMVNAACFQAIMDAIKAMEGKDIETTRDCLVKLSEVISRMREVLISTASEFYYA